MSRYTCAVCPAPIGTSFLMCASHWRLVPKPIADEVVASWGQLNRRSPPATRNGLMNRYMHARGRAVAAVEAASATSNQTSSVPA